MATDAAKWCLRRNAKEDQYVELLRVQGRAILYRGDLSPPVTSCVGTRGRRNWGRLPPTDASMFRMLVVPWPTKTILGTSFKFSFVRESGVSVILYIIEFALPNECNAQALKANEQIAFGGESLSAVEEQQDRIVWDDAPGNRIQLIHTCFKLSSSQCPITFVLLSKAWLGVMFRVHVVVQVLVVVAIDLLASQATASQVCEDAHGRQGLVQQRQPPNQVGEGHAACSTSKIDQLLDSLLEAAEENNTDRLKSGIQELRSTLRVTNGCKRRVRGRDSTNNDSDAAVKNIGGIQYSSEYLLDAVLLAGSLKALHPETHLLLDVVRQFPGYLVRWWERG